MLAMPSNLVAHHLRMLEQAGVISRRRSEGDRRRTHLRLGPGTLDSSAAVPRLARRVLSICITNSALSHVAAALWWRVSADPGASAGTRPAERIEPSVIAGASQHHLPLPRRRPGIPPRARMTAAW
jgi:hypothetical protein